MFEKYNQVGTTLPYIRCRVDHFYGFVVPRGDGVLV